jgi:hypothetical protein
VKRCEFKNHETGSEPTAIGCRGMRKHRDSFKFFVGNNTFPNDRLTLICGLGAVAGCVTIRIRTEASLPGYAGAP